MVNWDNFETPDELIELYRQRLTESTCGDTERIEIKEAMKILHRTVHVQRQNS